MPPATPNAHNIEIVIDALAKLLIPFVIAVVGYFLNRSLTVIQNQYAHGLKALENQYAHGLKAIEHQHAERLKLIEGQQALSLKIHEDQQTLAKEIRDLQSQKELQVTAQIALARLPAYKSLWALQELVSPRLMTDLTNEERKNFDDELRSWFYRDGNGIFLSLKALKSYLAARDYLIKEGVKSEEIRDSFSNL